MNIRKNRLLAALERTVAEIRGAIDAIVHDDYAVADEKFAAARDELVRAAEDLNEQGRPHSLEERADGPDKNGD